MKSDDDGGPAFPVYGSPAGMSLRDWFAGQALAGLKLGYVMPDETIAFARAAYALADAMLEAREESE